MSTSRKLTNRMRRRVARGRSERGAVFIEFALAVPFLVVMGLGVVEGGMAWKASTDVNSVTRNAARSASSAPAYAAADRTILGTVGAELTADQMANLNKVIVFKASAGQTTPPSNCKSIAASGINRKGIWGLCNVYSAEQVQQVIDGTAGASRFSGPTTCTSGSGWDNNWCPAYRNRSMASGNLDYLGVYVEVENKTMTGASFGNMTIGKTAVFRLEPAFGAS